MRIRLAVAMVAYLSISTFTAAPDSNDENQIVDDRFFETLERVIPVTARESYRDTFQVDAASWNSAERVLKVKAITAQEKGTFLSVMGLPDSTWVDAFSFSSDHVVEYHLPVADGRAPPCHVIVRSAFEAMIVKVMDAPAACSNPLRIAGIIKNDAGSLMPKCSVTVAVGDAVFTTIADEHGSFALEIYSASPDETVTITARGEVNQSDTIVRVYSGTVRRLRDDHTVRTPGWAQELFGRRHSRSMFAALNAAANIRMGQADTG